MKIQVLSSTTIKPSRPTPYRNRYLKLSLLDQIYPPFYNICVLFYDATSSHHMTSPLSNALQKSLAETLVELYPFAGRVRDNSYVECGDQGAVFVEARAECELSDFFRKPVLDSLRKFVPVQLLNDSGVHHLSPAQAEHSSCVLLVQLTSFSCGGFGISLAVHHKIGDGMSLISFLKSWSAATRGQTGAVPPPDFTGASLLPPVDNPPVMNMGSGSVEFPGWTARRFVFDTAKLASLKAELTKTLGFKTTDTELVTAILLRRLTLASGTFRPATVDMAVNLRPKMSPPLSENAIGNLVVGVSVSAETKNDVELDEFVRKMRRGLVEFYEEKASGFNGEDKVGAVFDLFKEKAERWKKGARVYTISSVGKFRIYETDFGWGKPAWVTSPMLIPMYMVYMDNKSGDGFEVWITLKEQVMAILERDEELLGFASLNPSIMSYGNVEPYCRM